MLKYFSVWLFFGSWGVTKIELSLSQKAEWEDYFLQETEKAQILKSEIEKTDRKIDQMVYQLYGLTQEEIAIVENSNQ